MSYSSRISGKLFLAILMLSAISVKMACAQPDPYHVVENWAKLPPGRTFGRVSGVSVDRHGNVWAFDRCGGETCVGSSLSPIMEFAPSGKFLKAFGAGMFVRPHSIYVDKGDNIWAVDEAEDSRKGEQVFKFSPSGKILMVLGKAGVTGDGPDVFSAPSAVVVAPNGNIFVADGHGGNTNARIVKFSPDGKFIKAWGKKGSEPGEFDTPHALAMDSTGRLFVADRGNNRIQIFDQDGKFLAQWKQFGRPSGIYIDAKDNIYVADSQSGPRFHTGYKPGLWVGSAKDGEVKAFIPAPGPIAKPTTITEGITADAKGNIYGGETVTMYLRKYAK